jgi:multisubunit Na+/H+ antiporter MnhF subunit
VADRSTLVLGVVAGASLAAVAAGELGRVWRRGSAPLPSEAPNLLLAAEEAVAETAQVARVGYREGSTRENAMFNLLTSFVGTFVTARVVTHGLRDRARVGPFRSVRVGRRHIHHFVPGIVIAFASGTGAIVTRDEGLEPILAVPFGIGMGLTLDESALLLELDDVYWSREGILSVQITLAVTALLASIALGLRFLRRGEQAVLEPGAA